MYPIKLKTLASSLLAELREATELVARLTPMEGVLNAAARGDAIQFRMPNSKWEDTNNAVFSATAEQYRIKPKPVIVKTRRFWWEPSTIPGRKRIVQVVTHAEQDISPREKWSGFVSWIDADWCVHEVPGEPP